MGGKTGTKAVYFDKLKGLLEEYKSIFIVRSPMTRLGSPQRINDFHQVSVDNVSSQQMHEIRSNLRGEAVVSDGQEHHGSKSAQRFPCRQPRVRTPAS